MTQMIGDGRDRFCRGVNSTARTGESWLDGASCHDADEVRPVGGIALVNAFANLGGFLGPTVIGMIKEQTGNFSAAMGALAAGLVMSAVTVLGLGHVMAARKVQSA